MPENTLLYTAKCQVRTLYPGRRFGTMPPAKSCCCSKSGRLDLNLFGQLWTESLRYHNNLAYQHEVTQVRLAAEWLLVNLDSL